MVCNDQDNVDNYLKNEGQIEDNNAKQQFQQGPKSIISYLDNILLLSPFSLLASRCYDMINYVLR